MTKAKIDLVAEGKNGTVELVLVEEGDWRDEPVADAITSRFQQYLYFAKEGPLVSTYPELAGRPIEIRVAHSGPLTPGHRVFLEQLADVASEHGVGVCAMELAALKGPSSQN